jgi:hypothetical protein
VGFGQAALVREREPAAWHRQEEVDRAGAGRARQPVERPGPAAGLADSLVDVVADSLVDVVDDRPELVLVRHVRGFSQAARRH